MNIKTNVRAANNLSIEAKGLRSTIEFLSGLLVEIQKIISFRSAEPVIGSRPKRTMLKSAKPAVKSKKAGASKPKKAQSFKAEASPELTHSERISQAMKLKWRTGWKHRRVKPR